jgi:outer membrane protein assembly factor BamB
MKYSNLLVLSYCTVFVATLMTAPQLKGAEGWPEWRGSNGQGIVVSTKPIPVSWSETSNVEWKTSVPGEGHSTPVVAENEIWLTSAISQQLTIDEQKERLSKLKNAKTLSLAGKLNLVAMCFDKVTGKQLAEVQLFKVDNPLPKHSLNSYASPSPILADGVLYCNFGSYGTTAINTASREVLWRNAEIVVDHANGPGSTPVLWKDKLICHFDGMDLQSIVAFDIKTGKIIWNTPRSGKMNDNPDLKKAYGTPLIAMAHGKPVVISPAADWVYGYDPETGKELWKLNYGKLGFSTVPRPVVLGDIAFVCTSFTKSRLVAFDYTGSGDITEKNTKWFSDSQIPQKPSPIVVDNRLYFVSDNGVASCLNAEDGKEYWRERIDGNYSASPILVNGMIYFLSQEGTARVVRDSGTYEVVATNKLDDGFMASPVVVDGALYLRGLKNLYKIQTKGAE